jgi:hypothetical protein
MRATEIYPRQYEVDKRNLRAETYISSKRRASQRRIVFLTSKWVGATITLILFSRWL